MTYEISSFLKEAHFSLSDKFAGLDIYPKKQQTYQTNFYKRTRNEAVPQFTSSEYR